MSLKSVNRNSKTPSHAEMLRTTIDYCISQIHTALPGRVERYDEKKQRADIKPLIKRSVILKDGKELSAESLPIITNVPIIFMRSSGFFISTPINIGDFVLLIFCERSIDNYINSSGIDVDPVDLRTHDLSDAIAIPGFYPFTKSLKSVSKSEMRLGEDEGIQLHLKKGGKIEVRYQNGLTLSLENKDGDAKIALGDGAVSAMIAETFKTFWNQVKTIFDTHTNPGDGPPPTPFPAYNDSITSSKVKFPNG